MSTTIQSIESNWTDRWQTKLYRLRTRIAFAGVVCGSLSVFPSAYAVTMISPGFMSMGDHQFGVDIFGSVAASAFADAQATNKPSSPDFPANKSTGLVLTSVSETSHSPYYSLSVTSAEMNGHAYIGNLGGSVTASSTWNYGNADAKLTARFMDVLHIPNNTTMHFTTSAHGEVQSDSQPQNPAPDNFARSFATTDLYLLPYGLLPSAGEPFNGLYHSTVSITPESGRKETISGDINSDGTVTLLAGDYWIAASLTVEAVAETNGIAEFYDPATITATGNFLHTANFFIDPPAGTTGAGYTTASGFDYRTGAVNAVPLPSAAWLFGPGVMGLFCASRKRKVI